MNMLCSDKTGTLPKARCTSRLWSGWRGVTVKSGVVRLPQRQLRDRLTNPIDLAIRTQAACDITGYEKLDEVPYDFIRQTLSILVGHEGSRVMITKGAVPQRAVRLHRRGNCGRRRDQLEGY